MNNVHTLHLAKNIEPEVVALKILAIIDRGATSVCMSFREVWAMAVEEILQERRCKPHDGAWEIDSDLMPALLRRQAE